MAVQPLATFLPVDFDPDSTPSISLYKEYRP